MVFKLERLDRALGSTERMDLFPRASLHHLSSLVSDHSPLSLHLKTSLVREVKEGCFDLNPCALKMLVVRRL